MNKNDKSIKKLRKNFNLPALEPKQRKCLRCETSFHSEHNGHRICDKCKTTNTNFPLEFISLDEVDHD